MVNINRIGVIQTHYTNKEVYNKLITEYLECYLAHGTFL